MRNLRSEDEFLIGTSQLRWLSLKYIPFPACMLVVDDSM